MEKVIQDVFGSEGIISSKFEDYKVRESQIEAIPIIWDSFKEGKHCLLEGPCGFGKTYAYLFPALMESAEKGKKVVIATSGITLQDQLIKKDLPFMLEIIQEVTGRSLSACSLKGKSNYICKKACKELEYMVKESPNSISQEEKDILDLANTSKTGDIDELGYVPNYNVWKDLNCYGQTGLDCKGCPFICFHKEIRAKAINYNVVVTNYHLLMSDIEAGGNILGKYDILVCDEGHELPNIIRDCFEEEFSNGKVKELKDRFDKLVPFGDVIDLNMLNNDIANLQSYTKDMFKTISSSFSTSKFGVMKNLKEFDISGYSNDIERVLLSLHELYNDLSGETREFEESSNGGDYYLDESERSNLMGELLSLSTDIFKYYKFMKTKIAVLNHNFDNDVVFVEHTNKGVTSFKSRMKKVDRIFYDNFVNKQNIEDTEISPELFNTNNEEENGLSILITSATLSVGGTFDYIKEQLGFYDNIETTEFIGSSPFNLEEQELWYLPYDAIEANKQGFNEVMLHNFLDLCRASKGGVLGLFTSVYNMNRAYDYLKDNLSRSEGMVVYKQGEYSRSVLIQKMRENDNVIVVGTKSLFTGVDVVGNNLRVVFIDKFPFPNISDPVVKELGNEPGGFFNFSIPEMVISLKQAVGRGVRSVSDKCVICIDDNRLATAKYKVKVNKSFGYKKQATRNLDDVKNFLGGDC